MTSDPPARESAMIRMPTGEEPEVVLTGMEVSRQMRSHG